MSFILPVPIYISYPNGPKPKSVYINIFDMGMGRIPPILHN